MAALVDPTGLYSAVVNDLYTQVRNAILDVINLEKNGEQLKEGYLNDLLSLSGEVLQLYDNASTPPDVLRMLKDLRSFLEDMSKQVSKKQSRNPFQRRRAAQNIRDALTKLEQFKHKLPLICQVLNRQDMAVVSTELKGISSQILTLTNHQSQLLPSMSTEHHGQRLGALQFGKPPASCSRFNILTLPPPDIPPIGISTEMSTLSSLLLDNGGAPWISLSGMGGIGKTFLVRMVCLLPEVRQHFQDRILWVRLGTNPQVLELQRDLYEAMSGMETRLLPSPEDGHAALCSLASSQRYLVVLDGAWMAPDSSIIAPTDLTSLNFLNSSNGSRIVVTSRDRSILDRLGVQHSPLEMHKFSRENSYTLFCKLAFNADLEALSNLEKYAWDLAQRCEGLPLVLEVVGKAMRSKREPVQWKLMLHKLSRGGLDERARILQLLRLSYDQLSVVQQRRFLALAILDSLGIRRVFLRIAWRSMDLLEPDNNYKDDAVAECAFNEALEELVSMSLATYDGSSQNRWIEELAWHIIMEEMQSLGQHLRPEEQDGGNSFTSFRVAVISKQPAVLERIKSPMVLPSLKLAVAQDTKVLWHNMHNMMELRFLHLDGHYESQTASIGELHELVGLSLSIRKGDYHKIEEALGSLVKMEHLKLSTDYRKSVGNDMDLKFLKQMPNLRDLEIWARRATSGSYVKHCHYLRNLVLYAHLADLHLSDLLHRKSSLEYAYIDSMSRESALGYTGFIPTTLKSFSVGQWTGGAPASSGPVFSSCQIRELSVSLPMESMLESFERLQSLERLNLDGCGLLAHLTSLNRLPRLKLLSLSNCAMQRLSSLSLPVLSSLTIDSCECLVEIGDIRTPKLQELDIRSCKSLVDIEGLTSSHTASAVPAEWYGHSDFSASSSSSQLSCAIPFSNFRRFTIHQAWESVPERLGCPETFANLLVLSLNGEETLVHLPSFARLPRLSRLYLENCAMQCLSLAVGPPGFPALTFLSIENLKYLVKIQGLHATQLRRLHLLGCPSLVEIEGMHCPGLRTVMQSALGGKGHFQDLHSHNNYRQESIRRTQQQQQVRSGSDDSESDDSESDDPDEQSPPSLPQLITPSQI